MDCTHSMRPSISNSWTTQVSFPHLKKRFAFGGYRDLNLPEDRQFSILDFTDEERCYSFVSRVYCKWGGDRG